MSDILKNKFTHYEVLPPEDVWRNIASELEDSNSYQPLAEKMYAFELEPPVQSWSAIQEQLKENHSAPVKNIRSLVYKLAAAAVVVGVILASSLVLFQQESNIERSRVVKAETRLPRISNDESSSVDAPAVQPPAATSLPTLNFRRPNVSNEPALVKASTRSRRILAAVSITPGYTDLSREMNQIMVHRGLIRNDRGDVIQDTHILTGGDNDDYISVTGPNGQQTRISAKFAAVLPYLNGNEHMQNEEWQRRFQDWRTKIMQTSFIPSSSNFLDILELKDFILNDNQQ